MSHQSVPVAVLSASLSHYEQETTDEGIGRLVADIVKWSAIERIDMWKDLMVYENGGGERRVSRRKHAANGSAHGTVDRTRAIEKPRESGRDLEPNHHIDSMHLRLLHPQNSLI